MTLTQKSSKPWSSPPRGPGQNDDKQCTEICDGACFVFLFFLLKMISFEMVIRPVMRENAHFITFVMAEDGWWGMTGAKFNI